MARRILTDVTWERVEPTFKQTGRGRKGKDNRNFVEAIDLTC